MAELSSQFKDMFSDLPGSTHVVEHNIINEPGKVKLRPYCIAKGKKGDQDMENGVIEESHSACCSSVILTPNPGGTERFCNDFKKLN